MIYIFALSCFGGSADCVSSTEYLTREKEKQTTLVQQHTMEPECKQWVPGTGWLYVTLEEHLQQPWLSATERRITLFLYKTLLMAENMKTKY